MKAETEIYLDILNSLKEWESTPKFDIPNSEKEIEKLFYCGDISEWTREALEEFRSSYDEETDLKCEDSRHYESKSVAKQLKNGKWIGYTYWFGGGKHGEPGAIDWVQYSYFLNCEKKLVEKNFFSKA